MVKFEMSRVLLLVPFALAAGSPYSGTVDDMYNSDYDAPSENKETVITSTPQFASEPLQMLVNEGETVRLPCQVDRLEGFVLLWKRTMDTDTFLTVGPQIIDKRFRLDQDQNGNNLILDQVSPADAGEYVCQISSYDPKFLSHKLTVRVEPVIETVPGELLVVREGEPATLTCQVVRGSPAPTLSWTRKRKGEIIDGNQVKWTSVTRHDGGHYICQADNGFGPEPVSKEVRLEVHHVPHVEIGEEFLHTAEGEEARVVCTIHCTPKCDVVWEKDRTIVDQSNPNYYINTLSSTHTLTILKVSQEFFGEYACKATNNMGTNSATVKVSGLAHPAVFQENTLSPWLDRFFLEWTVVSRSPVESFSLEYRPERAFSWSRREVKANPKLENEWQGSITLEGLAPATRYEAKVAARNQFGYSNYSKLFMFATKGADPIQQPSVSGSQSLFTNTVTYAVLVAVLLLVSSP